MIVKIKQIDGLQTALNLRATGSGTTNYLVRWSASTTITDSIIRDDGTTIGIGIAPDTTTLVNITAGTLTYGLKVFNTDASVSNNIGLYIETSNTGSGNNYSIIVPSGGGNVGLGVVAPTSQLHVVGSFRLVDGTQTTGYILSTDASGNSSWVSTSSLGLGNGIYNGSGTTPTTTDVTITDTLSFDTNLLYIDGTNSRIGIGVSPTAKLNVRGNGVDNILLLENSVGTDRFVINDDGYIGTGVNKTAATSASFGQYHQISGPNFGFAIYATNTNSAAFTVQMLGTTDNGITVATQGGKTGTVVGVSSSVISTGNTWAIGVQGIARDASLVSKGVYGNFGAGGITPSLYGVGVEGVANSFLDSEQYGIRGIVSFNKSTQIYTEDLVGVYGTSGGTAAAVGTTSNIIGGKFSVASTVTSGSKMAINVPSTGNTGIILFGADATSTTEMLQVVGGANIKGDGVQDVLLIQSSISKSYLSIAEDGNTVFNQNNVSTAKFRIEGKNDTLLFNVDPNTNSLAVSGTPNTTTKFSVDSTNESGFTEIMRIGSNITPIGLVITSSSTSGNSQGINVSTASTGGIAYGIYSDSGGSNGTINYGIYGRARNSPTNYGIYGSIPTGSGDNNYAIYGQNDSSGTNNYGGFFSVAGGVNSGSMYGIQIQVTPSNDSNTLYGIYSRVSANATPINNISTAGYFNSNLIGSGSVNYGIVVPNITNKSGFGTISPVAMLEIKEGQFVVTQNTTLIPTGTTQTIDFDIGNNKVIDLGSAAGNVTVTLTNPKPGAHYNIKVIQGLTTRDLIWASNIHFPGGVHPVISAGNDLVDLISLYYDGTNYLCSFIQKIS